MSGLMGSITSGLERRGGGQQKRRRGWYEVVTSRWCYLFMLPAVTLATLFTFYPMVMSWWFSTLDWTGFTADADFVGLDNYRELVGDQMFWDAFGRSLIFVLVGTPARVGLALLVAILLNSQVLKLSPVFRTMFFLPVVTTAAVVGIVMTFVLGSYQGPINQMLTMVGLIDTPITFLADPGTALWAVLGVQTWKNFGITMIYWLAALQAVPKIYYEAAKVDGAGPWQLIKNITVPILLPFAVIITVLTMNQNLHAFAIVQAMTQGGPYFSTQTIEVYIYQTAFAADEVGGVPRLGYASAAGCFFGTAAFLLVLIQLWAAKRVASIRSMMADASER